MFRMRVWMLMLLVLPGVVFARERLVYDTFERLIPEIGRQSFNGNALADGARINKLQAIHGGHWKATANFRLRDLAGGEAVLTGIGRAGQLATQVIDGTAGETTISCDVTRKDKNGFLGFGFLPGDQESDVPQVWMAMHSSGKIVVSYDGENGAIGSYEPGMDYRSGIEDGKPFETLSLTYDRDGNTVSGSINGQEVFTRVSLGGFQPVISRIFLKVNTPRSPSSTGPESGPATEGFGTVEVTRSTGVGS
jgi:hypothetical protein